jgi:L-ascorbate metabolism protein UlaG (beta-lactamase superfamily)
MIQPILADDALLADIAAAGEREDELHLWWLGQSGFLVQHGRRHLLLDSYLSDSLTKKYADTDKPHVRMTERCIAPERLGFVDAVTSSHNHTDHLDAETLLPILRANRSLSLIVPEANRQFAADRLGVPIDRLIGLDDGAAIDAAGFRITGVAAAHDEIEQDEAGHHRFLGYVVRAGAWTIYHSGDTRLYPGMAERLMPYAVDVALLPINGARPERRVAGNLSGVEAAGLAYAIGARTAIPCHYDMFEFNTASPDEFIAEAARLGQQVAVLKCGQRWTAC